MSFRVPPEDVVRLRELLKLSDEQLSRLSEALSSAPPEFNYYDLATKVVAADNISFSLTQGIIQVLVSLYRTADTKGMPLERFLDEDAFPSFMGAGIFSKEKNEQEWVKLRSFLLSTLAQERSIGTAAKAGPVQTDHDRIFCGAKILTDLRPLYHFDVSQVPSAATVVHMLKITYRDQFERKFDSFFALDSNDLEAMRQLIERAQKKEETLRNVMSTTGVTVLAAGYFY